MRVLHVLDFSPPFGGGIVGHLRVLGEALAARGDRLVAAFPRARPWFAELAPVCEPIVLPSIRRPLRSDFARRFGEVCRIHQIDLAHFHFSFALTLALAVRRSGPAVPIVYHWHSLPGALLPRAGRLRRGASGLLVRLADRRIVAAHLAVSAEIRDLLVDQRWISPQKITVLPNAVVPRTAAAPDPVKVSAREDPGATTSVPRPRESGLWIGSVANFRPEKDHPTLLRAFALVRRALPEARLILVGDGPTRPAVERLSRKLGLAGALELTGYLPDPDSVFDRIEVFVLSSHHEGQGLVLLEAMSHGLPIVATDLPAIRETVGADNMEFLARPGDAQGLARALDRLARDPALREEVGAANRERARTEFRITRWCSRLLELYDRLRATR